MTAPCPQGRMDWEFDGPIAYDEVPLMGDLVYIRMPNWQTIPVIVTKVIAVPARPRMRRYRIEYLMEPA